MKMYKIVPDYSGSLQRIIYRIYRRDALLPFLWDYLTFEDSMTEAEQRVQQFKAHLSSPPKYL